MQTNIWLGVTSSKANRRWPDEIELFMAVWRGIGVQTIHWLHSFVVKEGATDVVVVVVKVEQWKSLERWKRRGRKNLWRTSNLKSRLNIVWNRSTEMLNEESPWKESPRCGSSDDGRWRIERKMATNKSNLTRRLKAAHKRDKEPPVRKQLKKRNNKSLLDWYRYGRHPLCLFSLFECKCPQTALRWLDYIVGDWLQQLTT